MQTILNQYFLKNVFTQGETVIQITSYKEWLNIFIFITFITITKHKKPNMIVNVDIKRNMIVKVNIENCKNNYITTFITCDSLYYCTF